jgi:hypothetical protein
MEVLKTSGQAAQLDRVIAMADVLPPLLQSRAGSLQNLITPVNTICTNVPGPREARYMLGSRVELMIPLVPLAAGVGLGFAIVSYADQITIGLNADAEQVSNPWKIAQAVKHAYDELWAATGLTRVHEPKRVDSALKRRRRDSPRKHLAEPQESDAPVERRADSSDS